MSRTATRKFRALVLNADFRPLNTWPLSVISAEDAVCAVYRDKVTVVETWDAVFRSPSTEIPVPKIVALRHYAPIKAEPKFCRRSILLRDRFQCQFCLHRFEPPDLTFDHVLPRAAGGKTEWSNIVSCCVPCNMKKRDSLLKPIRLPRRPTTAELLRAGLQFLPADLIEDFGSFLHWSVELQA